MRDESSTKQDLSAGVGAHIPWRVVEVKALPGMRLAVRFADGVSGEVEMAKLIMAPNAGVFGRLRDPVEFARVGIEHGAVSWPGELDLAPDAMYDELKSSGRWVIE